MNAKQTIKRLLNYLRPYKWQSIIAVLTTLIVTLFSVLAPTYMGKVVSHLQLVVSGKSAIDFQYITNALIILGSIYVLSTFADIVQARLLEFLSETLVKDMRQEASNKVKKIPLSYFDQHRTGDLLSRITNDIDVIGRNIQLSVNRIFSSIILVIGIVAMMLIISPTLSLVFFITIPLNYFATKMITKRSQNYFKEKSAGLGSMVSFVEESFSGIDLIKAYGYEEQSAKDFKEINDRLYEVSYRASFMAGVLQPIMVFIGNVSYVLISVVGGILVVNQKLMLGDILAFIQYSQEIRHPIDVIADMANTFQEMLASAERVFEFLDAPEEEEVMNEEIHTPIRSIEFKNVDFGYEPGQTVIKDLSFKVNEGETVAIVGQTGAGKTTLVNLLLRFYDITSGEILINGIDIREVSRENLRKHFGMVLQDTWLIQGTIYDNIIYGNLNASEEDVIRSSKQAYAHHFITSLPNGYETELNEEATNISQGQKQLLTIARAFISDPAILILDEATSSVDTRTEQLIQKGMRNLMSGRTNFVIAHRLSTIVGADMILVMEQGQIVEQGTHKQLMDQKGKYFDLYQSQFME